MGTPRVEVDQQMCIGSGNCVEVAKGAFKLNDEEKAEVETLQREHRGAESSRGTVPGRCDPGGGARRVRRVILTAGIRGVPRAS